MLIGYDGNGFKVGDRVELHPACDMWMRGARFGVVVAEREGKTVSGNRARVKLDRFPRVLSFAADNVRFVENGLAQRAGGR